MLQIVSLILHVAQFPRDVSYLNRFFLRAFFKIDNFYVIFFYFRLQVYDPLTRTSILFINLIVVQLILFQRLPQFFDMLFLLFDSDFLPNANILHFDDSRP